MDVWDGTPSNVSPDVAREVWRKEIDGSNALGGHGELSKGSGVTARMRTSCLRQSQMRLVAKECASNPGRMEKILLTEPHRLQRKAADGSAVGIKDLSKWIPAPPLRSMGCLAVGDDDGDSGVSTDATDSEEDEDLLSNRVRVRAPLFELANLHEMYSQALSGTMVLESGDVLKIVGRAKDTWYAFKIGIEKDVDEKLATKDLIDVRGTFLGHPTIGKRYARMPRPSSNLLKLIPIKGLTSISGPPTFAKEISFFNTDNTDGHNEFSPMKYKCLEYVDWDISPPKPSSSSAPKAEQQKKQASKAKKAKANGK